MRPIGVVTMRPPEQEGQIMETNEIIFLCILGAAFAVFGITLAVLSSR